MWSAVSLIVLLRQSTGIRKERLFASEGRRTYDAFRAAGAPDDKARDAVVEIETYKNRPANIEADVRLLMWMVGLVLAGVLSLVLKTFLS